MYPASSTASVSLFRSALFALTAAAALSPSLSLAASCPNVHIIVDRSGSTAATFDGGTRFTTQTSAVTTLVNKFDGKLPIGVTLFPAATGTVCTPDPSVAPAVGNRTQIINALATGGPTGGSPLGTAVATALGLPELKDTSRAQNVIILTDGMSNCSGGATSPDVWDTLITNVKNAHLGSAAVNVYVVAFDNDISTADRTSLGRVADAGGKSAPTTERYYKPTSLSALNTTLDTIMNDILPGGTCGGTADTCYTTGCTDIDDFCIRGTCSPNPCAGVTCPSNQYCYTDGTQKGFCIDSCAKPCGPGTRCRGGACVAAPCGGPCAPGKYCDSVSGTCKTDSKCSGIKCPGTSQCVSGSCIDDPCLFVSCPSGTTCIEWEGWCAASGGGPANADMNAPQSIDMAGSPGADLAGAGDMGGESGGGGCATTTQSGQSAPWFGLLGFGIAAVALFTRRRSARV